MKAIVTRYVLSPPLCGYVLLIRRAENPQSQFLHDRGQVLFWATFIDGSKGLLLSDHVAVSELGCLLASRFWHPPLGEFQRIADA